jgi:hypothetical protein
LLSRYLERKNFAEAVEDSIQAFYDIRHERVDTMKANGLKMEKQPKRPWSFLTTVMMYAGLFLMVQLKYLGSFIWQRDPIVDWDAKEAVANHFSAVDA